jgi:hypothetical protein
MVQGFSLSGGHWTTARRVVAKVEFHAGELFPRLGFIVTNTQFANRKVVHFYNQRGNVEQWIKEGKQAVKMTRLSATGSGAMRSGCGSAFLPTTWETCRGD